MKADPSCTQLRRLACSKSREAPSALVAIWLRGSSVSGSQSSTIAIPLCLTMKSKVPQQARDRRSCSSPVVANPQASAM
eukprot:7242339-Heterocapsa_arctica.AAC.1